MPSCGGLHNKTHMLSRVDAPDAIVNGHPTRVENTARLQKDLRSGSAPTRIGSIGSATPGRQHSPAAGEGQRQASEKGQ